MARPEVVPPSSIMDVGEDVENGGKGEGESVLLSPMKKVNQQERAGPKSQGWSAYASHSRPGSIQRLTMFKAVLVPGGRRSRMGSGKSWIGGLVCTVNKGVIAMLTVTPDRAMRWDINLGCKGEGDGVAIVGWSQQSVSTLRANVVAQ